MEKIRGAGDLSHILLNHFISDIFWIHLVEILCDVYKRGRWTLAVWGKLTSSKVTYFVEHRIRLEVAFKGNHSSYEICRENSFA
jgi:hypothetical protein